MGFSGCEIEGEDGFPPQLTVISPANGDTVAGVVLFTSEVQDNIGVDRIEVLVDGTVHSTAGNAPWQCEWHTFEYESGREYEVILRAWDHAGNYDQCDPLLLTLDNSHIDPHQAWLLRHTTTLPLNRSLFSGKPTTIGTSSCIRCTSRVNRICVFVIRSTLPPFGQTQPL
jgi:hypothetical protein